MNALVCVLVTLPKEEQPEQQQQSEQEDESALTLQQLLQRKAQQLGVEQVFWTQDLSGQQLQARLELRQDERYERLLAALAAWGIGERLGTQLTLLSCMETQQPKQQQQEQAQAPASSAGSWQSFMDSVRCRLNVNQVVRVVRRDATINFDFAVLLMAAALLSCIGLLENSFLFLSSSMLISPLMGPIIAAIFGHVVGDTQLRWLGIRNELIGIGIALGTGFVCGGAICCWRGLARYFVLSAGLTEEMFTRCETHSLAIGLGTALASGAAAAIGVLGGNTGSLVGVAISASLLPPAVNAGLLWALALGTLLLQLDEQLLVALSKRRIYSPQLPVELFLCAVVSMALALLNILCVWLMGVVVLRIKEVAPAMQRDEQFWRHDVRLARQVALRDPQLQCAIDRLDVDQQQQQEQQVPDAPHYHHTWSPGVRPIIPTTPTPTPTAKQHTQAPSSYHTVHGFQNFCLTLHQLNRSTPTTPAAAAAAASPPPASPPLPSFLEIFGGPLPTPQRSLPDVRQVHFPQSTSTSQLPDRQLQLLPSRANQEQQQQLELELEQEQLQQEFNV